MSCANFLLPFKQATEIMPRLFMGDLATAESPATHSALRITHVLSVMPGQVLLPQGMPLRTLQIPIRDLPFEELAGHLNKTTAFIREALSDPQGSILVHCVQGRSRSASVISAYLMATKGWSVGEALDFVRSKRCDALPNSGFVGQLVEYASSLRSSGW